jgi:hypothetical protein
MPQNSCFVPLKVSLLTRRYLPPTMNSDREADGALAILEFFLAEMQKKFRWRSPEPTEVSNRDHSFKKMWKNGGASAHVKDERSKTAQKLDRLVGRILCPELDSENCGIRRGVPDFASVSGHGSFPKCAEEIREQSGGEQKEILSGHLFGDPTRTQLATLWELRSTKRRG